MKLLKRLKMACVALIVCLLVGEAGARIAGIVDFPLYSTGDDIGYIPKPSQSGKFLNKNDWVFNDKSMGIDKNWDPRNHFNILLIGNSIIMGGNPYAQQQKIAPLVQKSLTGNQILWPIATGGWSVVNETAYLEQNPEVAKAANFFVWEYMHGELSQLSQWRGHYVFPDEKPVSALWYAVRRYVLPRFVAFNMDELPPVGSTGEDHLKHFAIQLDALSKAAGHKPAGILLLYPTEQELELSRSGGEWLEERPMLEKLAGIFGITVIDVATRLEWTSDMYRDGIHPTVAGNIVLAKIIADGIASGIHETTASK
ncbi:lysophospholipase L1-like esterase [Oxalobacteraceae bacterium GrIS 1.18]